MNFFKSSESLRPLEKVPELIFEVKDLLEENYFEEVSFEEYEDGGYVFTNPKSDFELWVDVDGGDFIIKNIEIKSNNNGVGADMVEKIKEICRDDGCARIIANKVKSTAWDFWLDKCNFEMDIDNEENAIFAL